jgi:hypothetical protein
MALEVAGKLRTTSGNQMKEQVSVMAEQPPLDAVNRVGEI